LLSLLPLLPEWPSCLLDHPSKLALIFASSLQVAFSSHMCSWQHGCCSHSSLRVPVKAWKQLLSIFIYFQTQYFQTK
jgi:hypothetical protein